MAQSLSILGTSSHVGKSLITAGFCRILSREGIRVAPFKAQNMALNAFVTADGGEIGYAQALQARACGVLPTRDMNPVLIKPEQEMQAQLIVGGDVRGRYHSHDFQGSREALFAEVTAAYDRLSKAYEYILIEGAGSPVELNLMAGDLANLRMARYADAKIILVGDIDRGGVFAALWGTVSLMPEEDRVRLKGLIVNKFRGDKELFHPGRQLLENITGVPMLGVVPHIRLNLPEEDSMGIESERDDGPCPSEGIRVVVVRLPHMSNFTDFDALRAEPSLCTRFLEKPPVWQPQVVILPGTKTTLDDLRWLKDQGWVQAIRAWANAGSLIGGICGGYQMLGRWVSDPLGVEGPPRQKQEGIGLVPAVTVMQPQKTTRQRRGRVAGGPWAPAEVYGYELHAGDTTIAPEDRRPFLWLATQPDGWVSRDGRVFGTYLHGLFDAPGVRTRLVRQLGGRPGLVSNPVEEALSRWEEVLREHVDLSALFNLVGL